MADMLNMAEGWGMAEWVGVWLRGWGMAEMWNMAEGVGYG